MANNLYQVKVLATREVWSYMEISAEDETEALGLAERIATEFAEEMSWTEADEVDEVTAMFAVYQGPDEDDDDE